MFEDSTFESARRIHTRSPGWSVAAFALNGSILAALIAIPLIYPEALPKQMMNMLLIAPAPPPAAPRPVPLQVAEAFHGQRELVGINLAAPPRIPIGIRNLGPERAPDNEQIVGLDNGIGVPGSDPFHGTASKPIRVLTEEPKGPLPISKGVAEGMLIQKVVPRYPPVALATHTQGTVILQAVISKTGNIEALRVLSGNAMLQQAAVDAVSQWRYRPYLLNAEPIAVETTINVVFSLNR